MEFRDQNWPEGETQSTDVNTVMVTDNTAVANAASMKKPARAKILGMPRGLFIFLCVLVGCALLGCLLWLVGKEVKLPATNGDAIIAEMPGSDYVAVISVEGAIQSTPTTDVLGNSSGYNHPFTMELVNDIMEDEDNVGILLYINSPGGEVYASDELYLRLEKYKEETGRPVYAYFAQQAASASYYLSALSDCIVANRNCVTGSIGVKVGTFYDVSELLDTYGVKAFDIDSGEFKSMGSTFREMSSDERAIWQAYVDESYQRFIDVIADGRDMDRETVKKLADGRIYTASQALELNLIDDIGDFDCTKDAMMKECALGDVDFIQFYPPVKEVGLGDLLTYLSANIFNAAANNTDNTKLGQLNSGISLDEAIKKPQLYSMTDEVIALYE